MNEQELDARIAKTNELMVGDTEDAPTPTSETVDVFQQERDARLDAPRPTARGARPKMKLDLSMLDSSHIKQAYKKALDDSDYYTNIGNKQYANMIKSQYMSDQFMPTVDALVRLNGADAILANRDALRQLDQLTLLDGTRGSGYTEALVRSLYSPETRVERSDGAIRRGVKELQRLCENDQIRAAVGLAGNLKGRVDRGENIATSEDYETIQRVALYGV